MVERYGVESIRSPAASRRCANLASSSPSSPRCADRGRADRPRDDDQRGDAAPRSPTGSVPPGCAGSTSASTRSIVSGSPAMTRRDELEPCVLDGIDRRAGRRIRSGEDQRRRDARERRRDRRPRHGSGGPPSRCGSSSGCRSTPAAAGTSTRSSARTRSWPASTPCIPLEQVAAPGRAPADRWRYRDGGGTVGVIPSVTKPFCGDCDRVRAHRRRAVPHVPVRHRRDRPSRPPCAAARRRPARRPHRVGRCRQVGRPPHQPGRLRPPRPLDVPDRRLSVPGRPRLRRGARGPVTRIPQTTRIMGPG